ncbi:hypothetical protein BC939DRAFT_505875 [Gamsiella multidivaricata]|uniref:uncharacterized protein n=1 Tax=Gamsiella multidivaricata TaxID=101098 RepID=UPI00221FDDF5|nr:uncharacterized protein BC939DRAFT_505875 [Gamsiella multidivaricata]KAG0366457.1 hypothetical protein BGZ54_005339 [Gamsiella multidivaricata]KAI7819204.1 hypothetical protein BC939DRAFT_505875 [Gamsiella multidivaricata]
MTFVAFAVSWFLCLGMLLLSILLLGSTEAHIALLYPPPRGGFGTKGVDWRVHEFVGYHGYKFPCGGFPKGLNSILKAGQIVPVRFWTSEFKDVKRLPKKSIGQARHGGGMCEFSLSYDGGKSFHVLATYTRTCPDVAYEWPVRNPDNVPPCSNLGKCLLSWSWMAALIPQFYHNCADVTVQGVKNGRLPSKTIQLYNFKGHKQGVRMSGDGHSRSVGPGPIK